MQNKRQFILGGIFIACILCIYAGCNSDRTTDAPIATDEPNATAVTKVGTAGSLYTEDLQSPALHKTDALVICPGPVTVQGCDVSSYEYPIDWAKVAAAGMKFVIIRQSHGLMVPDTNFFGFWKGAQAAGLTVGAYQFFMMDQDALQQAQMFVNDLKLAGNYMAPNIPPCIDVEGTFTVSPATVIAKVNTWLEYVQTNIGRKPMLYTNPGTWIPLGEPTPSPFPYYWLANWTNKCPKVPSPWTHYEFWQYSAKGTVNGIPGRSRVDMDRFNGTEAEMKAL